MNRSLFLGVSILLLISCGDVNQPDFRDIEQFKVGKMGPLKTMVTANIRFHNSNSFGFKIKSMECALYLDSSFVGNFYNTDEIKVKGNSEFLLPIAGEASNMVLLQQSAKTYNGKPAIIEVKGRTKVGRMGFYRMVDVNFIDTFQLNLTGK